MKVIMNCSKEMFGIYALDDKKSTDTIDWFPVGSEDIRQSALKYAPLGWNMRRN